MAGNAAPADVSFSQTSSCLDGTVLVHGFSVHVAPLFGEDDVQLQTTGFKLKLRCWSLRALNCLRVFFVFVCHCMVTPSLMVHMVTLSLMLHWTTRHSPHISLPHLLTLLCLSPPNFATSLVLIFDVVGRSTNSCWLTKGRLGCGRT